MFPFRLQLFFVSSHQCITAKRFVTVPLEALRLMVYTPEAKLEVLMTTPSSLQCCIITTWPMALQIVICSKPSASTLIKALAGLGYTL